MSSKLARSAGLIGAATTVSRLLGLVREQVLAAAFGASASMQMDAYNIAFRIPNLLRDLFAEGAMTAAFIPTFTRILTTQSKEAAWRLGNLVTNALVLITSAFVVLGMVFAPAIIPLLVPEFSEVPGKIELTVQLTRVMLPFLTMVAIAAAMMGMLNSLRRFFVPSLSPAMFNVASIFSVLVIVPLMPWFGWAPIVGLAIGTLLGGLGQIVLQWPTLRREGFRYSPMASFKDPGVLEVLRLMGPATVGVAALELNLVVNMYLAQSQGQGAISWLQYAFRLMYLPIGVFGVSIATASLPEISRQAAVGDLRAIRGSVSRALRMMLMLNVPAAVGLMVLAVPIVEMIYERQAFHAGDTYATAMALLFYAPGLIGYSAVKIASPTFYSLRDSRTPVTISAISMVVNLSINLVLVRVMGYQGLAFGTAIAAIFNAAALLWLLRGRLGGIDGRALAVAFIKILMASLVMGAVAYSAAAWLTALTPDGGEVAKIVRVFGAIAIALVTLAVAARLLHIEEFKEAAARVLKRVRR